MTSPNNPDIIAVMIQAPPIESLIVSINKFKKSIIPLCSLRSHLFCVASPHWTLASLAFKNVEVLLPYSNNPNSLPYPFTRVLGT